MPITSENKIQLNSANYFDTSLQNIPGPRRTFEGIANTGNEVPRIPGRINLKLDTKPVGLEILYRSPRFQRAGLYTSGVAMYVFSVLEGGSSLWLSGTQITERLLDGRTNISTETYLATQLSNILSMVLCIKFAGDIIRAARKIRTH